MFVMSLDFCQLPPSLFFGFSFHYILLRLSIVCLFTSRFCDVKFVLLCHVIDELLKHNCNSGVMKVAI